ncbi:hypothetical protein [Pseudonocardia sediminis]|uniref:hypothetical protein n=1 Tax=Pseudonocardia sediminis TaxID=1397368 RepID=UPI00102942F3|nr:hypothetical protein [Pseudonocardia sediminis]
MAVAVSILAGALLLGAGTALASPKGGDSAGLTSITKLEDLRGLPCGADTQFGEGRVDFRIFGPPQQSTIQWHCVTEDTAPLTDQEDIPYDLYPDLTPDENALPLG